MSQNRHFISLYFVTGQCHPLSPSLSLSLSLVPPELGEGTQNLSMFVILSDCVLEHDAVHAKRLSVVAHISSDAIHRGGDQVLLPCLSLRIELFGK